MSVHSDPHPPAPASDPGLLRILLVDDGAHRVSLIHVNSRGKVTWWWVWSIRPC